MKPRFLRVKNLERYQHYGTRRNPPWVKLYREFLSDYQLRQCPIPSRLFFGCCFILASETSNCIPYDVKYLTDRVGFEVTEEIITTLIDSGLLLASTASKTLAYDKKLSNLILSDLPNSSLLPLSVPKEGKESEKGEDNFASFWAVYPRKIGKGEARKSWHRIAPANGLCEKICQQVSAASKTDQWQREGGKYIPLPATWLNQSRWEDDYSLHTPVKPIGLLDRMHKLTDD